MSILLRSLDLNKIIATLEQLERRITERFPTSTLVAVCHELVVIAQQADERSNKLSRPIWALRLCVAIVVGFALIAFAVVLPDFVALQKQVPLVDFLQGVEAGVNDVIFIGAGLFFLLTWETRIKRSRALRALHELRSVAHIIDMHQLTKDPERILSNMKSTASSPRVQMNSVELGRFLDYCSEMLSLTGKIAAVYAENLNDSVVLAAVNEIETLTTGFSRKIWQKIMILHAAPAQKAS